MYLALRWLVGLSLAMWVAVCCIDLYNESIKENQYKGFTADLFKSENITNTVKRESVELQLRKSMNKNEHQNTAMFHYAMFFAGALAVSVFNKKKEIILFTRRKIIHINIYAANFLRDIKFKRTAYNASVTITKYLAILWEYCRNIIKNYLIKRKTLLRHRKINLELLKKIKEYAEERKNLGQLLISAIHENKNIRMRYQIETMAKDRLLKYIEDTQKQIKEDRSKYVSFQHLYLATHQDNVFLKARLKKVSKEKEEIEKNLISLVNEVYQSKSNELKAYCSRFIIRTRENLLHSDVTAEIQKFLNRTTASTSSKDNFDYSNLEADTRIAEIVPEDETLVPLTSEGPKLKGLPGECILTVKDKNGIIEKLYECDYETDFDKGDTIRRIRKYSVYHDNDCLLDYSNSKTAVYEISSGTIALQQQQYMKVEYPITSNRFLTGSPVFQKFLQDNQNFIQLSTSRTPALTCE
ncbi:uncharacterized protein [Epargyreus clarus]|uniref:uncharacterized protein n=1 Tax=Epargyreus clarus TaxID=520877 RepID=UPI003C2EECA9